MATIPYITGFNVKPLSVSALGIVTFTDGTNDITPNQSQCEAYGYTYDKASGTCTTFRYNTNLNRNISNINNTIRGSQNTTETGVNNTLIMGESNTVRSLSRNNLIVGTNNEIASGVNNATVVGSNGTALNDGEFVIGSNVGQNSTLSLNGATTDATPTDLFVNGDTAVTVIARTPDKVYYYKIDIHAYRTGGASGSGAVNDRAFYTLRGIVNGVTFDESLTLNIGRGTTVGWTAETRYLTVSTVDEMYLRVTGVAAMDIQWEATVNLYEMTI
tara:strand:- start:1391 stop:2209 length:819 start_codon:yes stop_codon:yes gene_type:complete